MIELTPLARPYAKALFSSAKDSKKLDQMADELKVMAAASTTEGVINTIENPSLSRQEIVDILIKLFEENVSSNSLKLIEILAENKRLKLLEPIYFIYQDLLEKHNDQTSIEVFVAAEPGEKAKENIEKKQQKTHHSASEMQQFCNARLPPTYPHSMSRFCPRLNSHRILLDNARWKLVFAPIDRESGFALVYIHKYMELG